MPPRIVGFAGFAGVGKSTLAAAMNASWGYEVTSFATLIRDLCVNAYRIDTGALDRAKKILKSGGTLTKEQEKEAAAARAKMWVVANALRAAAPGSDPIVNYAFRFCDMGIPPRGGPIPREVMLDAGEWKPKIVFDDVRRTDEVAAIKQRGGVVLWLKGPSLWGERVPTTDTDISESDCHRTVDVAPAVKAADALRSQGRRREAQETFQHLILSELDKVYGFTQDLESSGADVSADEDDDETSDLAE